MVVSNKEKIARVENSSQMTSPYAFLVPCTVPNSKGTKLNVFRGDTKNIKYGHLGALTSHFFEIGEKYG